nr:HipA N-terminal domain-containing protein [uncultured Shinella sp.]
MPKVSALSVRLYGEEIGTSTYVGAEKTLFAFNDAYVKDPERPTLGLQFKNGFGELIADFRPYKIKLMPYFSNLLPEGHLRRYLAGPTFHIDRKLFLLWVLGQDLPGAITVVPADGEEWPYACSASRYRLSLATRKPRRTNWSCRSSRAPSV